MISDKTPHEGNRAINDQPWIESYLDYTDYQEAAEEIHFWTALSLISAALRRRAFMDRQSYILYPNLYVIIVAESAKARKSVAINTGLRILRRAVPEINLLEAKITPEGLVKNLSLVSMNGGKPVTKATDINGSIAIYADELATFFGFDRQAASRMGILLTEIYACKDEYNHITKTDKSIFLRNLYPTLLAATDPRNLKVLPEEAVGGFLGRTIFVNVRDRKQNVAWPMAPENSLAHETKLVIDLARISSLKGVFVPTRNAKEIFELWYNNFSEKVTTDTRADAFIQRAPDHALKIAMILSAAETNTMVVTDKHIVRGIGIVEKQLDDFRRSMEWTSPTAYGQTRMKVIDLLRRKGGTISRSEVMRNLALSKEDMDIVQSSLDEEGMIEIKPIKGGTILRLK
jgi:hypothetical protein